MTTSHLNQLNPAQLEAVTTVDGPVLVIAGAGSGKTRTLIHRVAHLINQGVAPEQIMLLTFTRKAAQEMINRATLLLDESCHHVKGGTFHATANILLRRYGRYLGYPGNFTIIDRTDAEGIINLIKTSLKLTGKDKSFPKKNAILNVLSKAINKSVPLQELMEYEYQHMLEYIEDFKKIRDEYKAFKENHALMDYDDLLINWHAVMNDFPEVRAEMAARFSHIMVDEYQDTNPIQAAIVKLLAQDHQNIMAVGDDSQSIYSFRGADFNNIMQFPKFFQNTKIIRLEENYRSTQAILSTANAIIEHAQEKYEKELFTNITGGDRPVIHEARDEKSQAKFITDQIITLNEQGTPLPEIAVLFRSGFHSFQLELELNSRHLKFDKRGGMKLTESAHIKDLVSYLRVISNGHDYLSWNRILLHLDSIGPKTAEKILSTISEYDDPLMALKTYKSKAKWTQSLKTMAEILIDASRPGLSPLTQFEKIMAYYQDKFEKTYADDFPRRSKDLEQLKEIIAGYGDLQAFLDASSLDPPEPVSELNKSAGQDEKLILSTIHSAKGLEWDAVMVINMLEDRFPSKKALDSQGGLEEERRLFYVAVTRAKKQLFLTYPRQLKSTSWNVSYGTRSQFLNEIPPRLLDYSRNSAAQAAIINPLPQNRTPTIGYRKPPKTRLNISMLKTGTLVQHSFFGQGKIIAITGKKNVDIEFPKHGIKTLHLDYAKLELV
jgi:DNA helicase II / ATP-dependent DNA helicase PcrA